MLAREYPVIRASSLRDNCPAARKCWIIWVSMRLRDGWDFIQKQVANERPVWVWHFYNLFYIFYKVCNILRDLLYFVKQSFSLQCQRLPFYNKVKKIQPGKLSKRSCFLCDKLSLARCANEQGDKIYPFGCEDDVYPLLAEEQISMRCTRSLRSSCATP